MRRSRNEKTNLAKRDVKREGSEIESNYAELNFAKKTGGKPGSPSKASGASAAPPPAQGGQIIYSSIDHNAKPEGELGGTLLLCCSSILMPPLPPCRCKED